MGTARRAMRVEPWLVRLLAITILEWTAVWGIRPLVSYRALALGANAFELGVIASCFASLAILVAVPLGRAIDQLGERPLIVIGAALTAASCVAIPFLHSIPALALSQAALGGGQILVVVSGHTALANRGPDEGRAWRVGLFMSAGSLGQAIGPAAAGMAVGSAVTGPGSDLVFLAAAACAGATVLLGLALSFDRCRDTAAHATPRTGGPALRDVLRTPGVPASLAAGAAVLVSLDLMTIYLPAYGLARGIPPEAVGIALALLALAQVISRLGLGWLVARFGHFSLTIGSLVLSAALIPCLVLPVGPEAMIALLAGAGLGLGLCPPLTLVWVALRTPSARQGSVMALRMGLNRFGELAVPPLVGAIAGEAGIIAVMWCVSAILGLATAGVARSRAAIGDERRRAGAAAADTESAIAPLQARRR